MLNPQILSHPMLLAERSTNRKFNRPLSLSLRARLVEITSAVSKVSARRSSWHRYDSHQPLPLADGRSGASISDRVWGTGAIAGKRCLGFRDRRNVRVDAIISRLPIRTVFSGCAKAVTVLS